MAWLWFINSELVEGVCWLDATHSVQTESAAPNSLLPLGFLTAFSSVWPSDSAAAISECQAALVALTTGDDRIRRAESLVLCATVLMREEYQRSLEVLKEAHDLLEETEDSWQLAQHDWIVAENLMLLGRFDDAEPAARSSAECFGARGDVWASLGPLSMLGGIAAARGDLEGASANYEALLERSRCGTT